MALTAKSRRGRPPKTDGEHEGQKSATVRQSILQAARQRFVHYGYKKTTIDEIAGDAGVGKGTVYLYFDGKDEILLTLVLEVKQRITEQMRTVAVAAGRPQHKLKQMIVDCVLSVYDACTASAHGSELVDDLRLQLSSHLAFAEQFGKETEAQLALIVHVLREGNIQHVFAVNDPPKTAYLLLVAFAAYFPPYACHSCPQPRSRDEIEAGTQDLMDFLLAGLQRCR